jgi:hypothetical protein
MCHEFADQLNSEFGGKNHVKETWRRLGKNLVLKISLEICEINEMYIQARQICSNKTEFIFEMLI